MMSKLLTYSFSRAIGIATNSTEEVGRIYLNAIRNYAPEISPTAYLGDAAEAFANAARNIFPTITIRLMCFAHVYKVSYYQSRIKCPLFTQKSDSNVTVAGQKHHPTPY